MSAGNCTEGVPPTDGVGRPLNLWFVRAVQFQLLSGPNLVGALDIVPAHEVADAYFVLVGHVRESLTTPDGMVLRLWFRRLFGLTTSR